MKILMYLPMFYPSVGGLEIMAEVLARGFTERGHEVRVVTCTEGDRIDDSRRFPFPVFRHPDPKTYFENFRWCNLFFQRNIALRGLWPFIFLRRPYVVSHGGWYYHQGADNPFKERLKHWLTSHAVNICPSRAIAEHLLGDCTVISNAYRDDIFFKRHDILRNKDLIYVGRLASVKGVHILIRAVAELYTQKKNITLTIVGSGPEEDSLKALTVKHSLDEHVTFLGPLKGEEVALELSRHRIMVIPSINEEPFGTVALEGIACGCAVIGTDGGGLPEAIGLCGITVPRADASALAGAIWRVLSSQSLALSFQERAQEHLARHSRDTVISAYLEAFTRCI